MKNLIRDHKMDIIKFTKKIIWLQQVLDYRDLDYRDPRNTGIFFSRFFWIYRVKVSSINGKKFDYRDFSRKIPIIEVNKCSVVNLKIQLLGFFEIFGRPCPDN